MCSSGCGILTAEARRGGETVSMSQPSGNPRPCPHQEDLLLLSAKRPPELLQGLTECGESCNQSFACHTFKVIVTGSVDPKVTPWLRCSGQK